METCFFRCVLIPTLGGTLKTPLGRTFCMKYLVLYTGTLCINLGRNHNAFRGTDGTLFVINEHRNDNERGILFYDSY